LEGLGTPRKSNINEPTSILSSSDAKISITSPIHRHRWIIFTPCRTTSSSWFSFRAHVLSTAKNADRFATRLCRLDTNPVGKNWHESLSLSTHPISRNFRSQILVFLLCTYHLLVHPVVWVVFFVVSSSTLRDFRPRNSSMTCRHVSNLHREKTAEPS
jgi:hypothetical protein